MKQKRIMCIESLAGSFENCIRLGIRGKVQKELVYLAEQHGQLYYLSKDHKRSELGKGITHLTFPQKTPSLLMNLAYLFSPFFHWHAFRECDTYYIHNVSGAFPAVLSKWIFRNKRIITKYDWNWSFTFRQKYSAPVYHATRLLEYLSLSFSDVVIASTERLASEVSAKVGHSSRSVVVIPNWVDRSVFNPRTAKRQPNPRSPILISVGRLDDGKNHLLLLRAAQQLTSESCHPKIIIIGDGELRESLTSYAARNHLALTIIPRVEHREMPRYLRCADLFVMSSRYEGLPQAVLEAFSCGLPVVGTNVRGINDAVEHGLNGMLCDERAESIASAIMSVLGDEHFYARLRSAAIATAERYSFERVMREINGVINHGITR